jgi:hypothetical protein
MQFLSYRQSVLGLLMGAGIVSTDLRCALLSLYARLNPMSACFSVEISDIINWLT